MTDQEVISNYLKHALRLATGQGKPVLSYLIEMALLENKFEGDDVIVTENPQAFQKPAGRASLTVVR